jgi:hypothetical protein
MTTKAVEASLAQIWFNVQKMDKKERKKLIRKILKMNSRNTSFIDYAAKDFLIKVVEFSEPYFNKTGTTTPVKEFVLAEKVKAAAHYLVDNDESLTKQIKLVEKAVKKDDTVLLGNIDGVTAWNKVEQMPAIEFLDCIHHD